MDYKQNYINLTGDSVEEKFMHLSEPQKDQVQYCISQMKRFASCMFLEEYILRRYQFFYQIGRIQELLGSTPDIWWNPFETMIAENNYIAINNYVDVLRSKIGCEYSVDIITKAC